MDDITLIDTLRSDGMHEAIRNSGYEDELTAAISDAIDCVEELVDVKADLAALRSRFLRRGEETEAQRQALAWFEAREPHVRAVADAWSPDFPERTALIDWERENKKP